MSEAILRVLPFVFFLAPVATFGCVFYVLGAPPHQEFAAHHNVGRVLISVQCAIASALVVAFIGMALSRAAADGEARHL